MHIVVCVKDIPNPEAPAALFSIDDKAMRMVPVTGLSNVTSPFDEQALELALREKDRRPHEVRVTAVSLGPRSALQAVKRALAMGADDGLHILDQDTRAETSMVAAYVLALAIRELGSPDLVITGRQAADWDVGVVGCGMAELLGWPVVSVASRIEVIGRSVEVDRQLEDGHETVRSSIPCVVTAANEVGAPRKASLRETIKSGKKPVVVRELKQLWHEDRSNSPQSFWPTRVGLLARSKNVECHYLVADPRGAAREIYSLLCADGVGRADAHA